MMLMMVVGLFVHVCCVFLGGFACKARRFIGELRLALWA